MSTTQLLYDPNLKPSSLVADLIDERGGFQLERLCNVLGVEKSTFAYLTDRTTESVAKLFSGQFVKVREAKTKTVINEMIQLVSILRAMGLEDDAPRWMKTPLPSFEGKSPLQLVAENRGQELVSRLLAIASGNVGT
jgi:Protein of unknown function (DUF2384)